MLANIAEATLISWEFYRFSCFTGQKKIIAERYCIITEHYNVKYTRCSEPISLSRSLLQSVKAPTIFSMADEVAAKKSRVTKDVGEAFTVLLLLA